MATTQKLYEIAAARNVLDAWLAESEGEVTPELEQLLGEIEAQADEKIERVALYIRERKAQSEAIKVEEQRLGALRKAHERAAESLTNYLHRQMTALGKEKVQGLLCTVTLQKNPPSVMGDLSAAALLALRSTAPEYVRHIPESFALDRRAVLDHFKATGQMIHPALAVIQGNSLRIR